MKTFYLVGGLLLIAILYQANPKLGMLLALVTVLGMYISFMRKAKL